MVSLFNGNPNSRQPATEASTLLWSHLRIHRERGVAKVLEIAAVSPEAAFEIVSEV